MRELNEHEIDEIMSIEKEKRRDFVSSIYDESEVNDILAFVNVREILRERTKSLKEVLFDKYCKPSSDAIKDEDDEIEISNLIESIETIEEIEEEIEVC